MNKEVLISLCASAFWLGVGFLIFAILIMRHQLIHYGSVLLLSFVMLVYCGFGGFMFIAEKTAPNLWLFVNKFIADRFTVAIFIILFAVSSGIVSIVSQKPEKENAQKVKPKIGISFLLVSVGSMLIAISYFIKLNFGVILQWYSALLFVYFAVRTFLVKEKTAEYWLVITFSCLFTAIAIFSSVLTTVGQLIPEVLKIFEVLTINAFSASLIFLVFIELQIHSPEITALDSCIDNLTQTTRNYVSDFFLKELDVSSINELRIGDRVKKDVTILFSDLRSFTELSEQLSPEQNFAFINSYLSRMVPLISQNNGFIDKYLGDGIMAVFPDASGADNALRSAVQMQEKIQEYNRHRANSGYRPVSLGVGINTGSSIMGVIGTDERYEATVISDAVNLASRLQSISKAFNIGIVISESTFLQIAELVSYRYRFIGKVRVKGKNIPISVFEIFNGLPEEILEKKLKVNTIFEQGMIAYYQKAYAHAVTLFKQALEILPDDGAAKFYLQASLQKILLKKQFG